MRERHCNPSKAPEMRSLALPNNIYTRPPTYIDSSTSSILRLKLCVTQLITETHLVYDYGVNECVHGMYLNLAHLCDFIFHFWMIHLVCFD